MSQHRSVVVVMSGMIMVVLALVCCSAAAAPRCPCSDAALCERVKVAPRKEVFAFMVDNSFSNWKGYVRTTPPPHDAVAFLVVFLFFLFVLFLSSPTL
jgi:hypothetical protein